MHELSICQALVSEIETLCEENTCTGVAKIWLRIGALSGVEPQLLERAFPLAAAGTVAADAELIIETAPLRVYCETCQTESSALPNRLVCGHCGDWHTRLLSGDEMILESLELIKTSHSEPASPGLASHAN